MLPFVCFLFFPKVLSATKNVGASIEESNQQNALSSRCYDIILSAPKYSRRPALGNKDKKLDRKFELNNKKSVGETATTVSQRLCHNGAVVDSTNRTTSGLM